MKNHKAKTINETIIAHDVRIHRSRMAHALQLAKRAAQESEVPVGAIVVYQNKVIGEGWNRPIATHDPTAHAEIQAIRQAAKNIGNYRLLETTLYVTLEPCVMCLAAMIHARIGKLVFGADDPKGGAIRSAISLQDAVVFNHSISWVGGIMAEDCGEILSCFFEKRR